MFEQLSLLDVIENTKSVVVFDLETQNLFSDVGGDRAAHLLKLSVGVTYNTVTGEYKNYHEPEVEALIDELFRAEIVVGYNLMKFDYRVLAAYTNRKFSHLRTVDMFDHLYRRLGFRVSLDSVASATLGAKKIADGCQAVSWWRAGEVAKLCEYCQEDVRLTHQVYQFGKDHGYVLIRERAGGTRRVPVMW
jgi:DEAD/DEAH box helicase domain-containing protein